MEDTKKGKLKKKILVVEDDEDIRNLVLFNLEMTGEYELLSSDNGEDALVLAQKHIPALVILDVMLPGIDGFEVCRQLKAGSTTHKIPIVMLTARSDDNDVVKGFELGVEDYLRKPFSSMKILLARVSNILQRHDTEAPKITLGELELSPLNYSVISAGETVDLSYSEFKILQLLMENPGVTYTREAIMTVIKAGKSSLEYEDTSRKKASALRSIDVQVLSLRKKLGKCGKYIQTVRSAGYMIQIEP
ncbi:MAG: response regulator transcription factor [Spirochaetia bacterium]|nr:response regulator transcription factor [Spirochaetia bacterium]